MPSQALNARKIYPKTHAFDDAGITLTPARVRKALRHVAGIAVADVLRRFVINLPDSGLVFWVGGGVATGVCG